MFQIDNATVANTKPAPTPPGVAGYFTDGNPATGQAATIVPAEWLNAIMMEVLNVLAAANVTPDKTQFNQLLNSIGTVTRGLQATETLAGVAKIATQALANAGADDTTMMTPKKMRNGVSMLISAIGYIALPSWLGGLIIQWGSVAAAASGVGSGAFPVTFPNGLFRAVCTYLASGTAMGVSAITANTTNNSTFVGNAFNTTNGAGVSGANIWYIAIGY
jgi:hypothetical protein